MSQIGGRCRACGEYCEPSDVGWRRLHGKTVRVCGHCGVVFGEGSTRSAGGGGFLGMTGAALVYPFRRMGLIHLAALSLVQLTVMGFGGLLAYLLYCGLWVVYLFTLIRVAACGGTRFPGLEDLSDMQGLLVSVARYFIACVVASVPILLALFLIHSPSVVILGAVMTAIMFPAMLATAAMTTGCLAGMNPIPALSLIRAYPLQYLLVLVVFAVGGGVEALLNGLTSSSIGGNEVSLVSVLVSPLSIYVTFVTMRVLGNFVFYAEQGGRAA